MSDWELRRIQDQLRRLDEKARDNKDLVNDTKNKIYIWLIILSIVLFFLVLSRIEQQHDSGTQSIYHANVKN